MFLYLSVMGLECLFQIASFRCSPGPVFGQGQGGPVCHLELSEKVLHAPQLHSTRNPSKPRVPWKNGFHFPRSAFNL